MWTWVEDHLWPSEEYAKIELDCTDDLCSGNPEFFVYVRLLKSAAHSLWILAPPTSVLLGHAYGCVMNTRGEVLRLYRRILHVARHWEASPRSEINSAIEQQYIKDEARRLFRRNKEVSKMRV